MALPCQFKIAPLPHESCHLGLALPDTFVIGWKMSGIGMRKTCEARHVPAFFTHGKVSIVMKLESLIKWRQARKSTCTTSACIMHFNVFTTGAYVYYIYIKYMTIYVCIYIYIICYTVYNYIIYIYVYIYIYILQGPMFVKPVSCKKKMELLDCAFAAACCAAMHTASVKHLWWPCLWGGC